jgi:acyl-CoA synthetase (AMP-forming)/AMP-acid ligase II
VAFVVAPSAEPEQIRLFANDRLGRHQRLAQLHLVDSLPRNAIGKLLKRELRERLERAAKSG